MLCLNLDLVMHPRISMEEYLNKLESTLKPSVFEGLAQHIFEQTSQEDQETVSAYWEKLQILYKEAKIKDVIQFKEAFLKGLANKSV